jgi:hypothetical protein
MSRGNFAYKETDYARAVRVALKAGLTDFAVRVIITADGPIYEIRCGQPADQAIDLAANEWEDWKPNGQSAA